MDYPGGFLVQGLFESESWSSSECALSPLAAGYAGYDSFPWHGGIFLYSHTSLSLLSHHTVAFFHFLMSSGFFFPLSQWLFPVVSIQCVVFFLEMEV